MGLVLALSQVDMLAGDRKKSNDRLLNPGIVGHSGSESQIWNVTWGGAGSDTAYDVWSDGTYLYVAAFTSINGGSMDLALLKCYKNGTLVWYRTWGASNKDDHGFGVWGDATGIYVCGDTQSYAALDRDIVIVKWDANGNKLWNNTWVAAGTDRATDVWGNASVIYTVGIKNYFSGTDEVILATWDPTTGGVGYITTYGNPAMDQAYGIWGDSNGFVYTAGMTNSYTGGNMNTELIKWYANGTICSNHSFGAGSGEWCMGMWSDNTNLFTIGWTDRNFTVMRDCLLIKWDMAGNAIWNRTFGSTSDDFGYSVWGDGSWLYTAGITGGFGAVSDDQFLVKWNVTSGDMAWYRTWGTTNGDQSFGICGDSGAVYTCGVENSQNVSLVKWNRQGEAPVADLSSVSTSVRPNDPVQFHYTGTDGDGIAFYQWDFGDGTPNGTGKDPTHPYTTGCTPNGGLYNVTLTVRDVDGDSSTIKKVNQIFVNDWPVADFHANMTNITIGQEVLFTFNGSVGNGITRYQWYFGDGTPNSTVAAPVHKFTIAGKFTVTLTVMDIVDDNSTKVRSDYIIVDAFPVAAFTASATSIKAGQSVTFTFTGDVGDGPASFQWSFGDGSANATVLDPVHAFSAEGTYKVVLTVTDADGDTSTQAMYITVAKADAPAVPGFSVGIVVLATLLGVATLLLKRKNTA
jgi:PKD repeat protein